MNLFMVLDEIEKVEEHLSPKEKVTNKQLMKKGKEMKQFLQKVRLSMGRNKKGLLKDAP